MINLISSFQESATLLKIKTAFLRAGIITKFDENGSVVGYIRKDLSFVLKEGNTNFETSFESEDKKSKKIEKKRKNIEKNLINKNKIKIIK